MRLLVVTQKVDEHDPALGFFHTWLSELAKHAERVEVVCLGEGSHHLPDHVHVHSLGKESAKLQAVSSKSRTLSRIGYVWRFYRRIWKLRSQYDSVFVHMNPEYIVLAGLLWRMWGKRIVLWYTHRAVTLKLRVAVALAHAATTAAPESLQIKSPKVHVIGHGIDTARFMSAPVRPFTITPRIVSVGRITPIKNLECIVDAVLALRARGIAATLTLIGEPTVSGDVAYKEALQRRVGTDQKAVTYAGAVSYEKIAVMYQDFDLAVNATSTGGVDKAVLESMASGVPTFAANRAFIPYFGQYADMLLFADRNAEDLAKKMETVLQHSGVSIQQFVRESAHERGDVTRLVDRLLALLS